MNAFAIMADSVAQIGLCEVETPSPEDYGIGDLHDDDNVESSGYSTPRRRHSPGEYGKSPQARV